MSRECYIELRPAFFMVDDNVRPAVKKLADAHPEGIEGLFKTGHQGHGAQQIAVINQVVHRFGWHLRTQGKSQQFVRQGAKVEVEAQRAPLPYAGKEVEDDDILA